MKIIYGSVYIFIFLNKSNKYEKTPFSYRMPVLGRNDDDGTDKDRTGCCLVR